MEAAERPPARRLLPNKGRAALARYRWPAKYRCRPILVRGRRNLEKSIRSGRHHSLSPAYVFFRRKTFVLHRHLRIHISPAAIDGICSETYQTHSYGVVAI